VHQWNQLLSFAFCCVRTNFVVLSGVKSVELMAVCAGLVGNNDPMWSVPSAKSKITSAVWGPLDEVIITGHENGDLCQWDVSV